MTHRVAKTFANRLGKKVVQLHDRERVSVPVDFAGYWHIVCTGPLQERRAHAWLTSQGCRVYAPMQVRWAHHSREKKATERALFPGYLFLSGGVIPDDRETRIRNGVRHIDWLPNAASTHLAYILDIIAKRQLSGEFDEPGTTVRAAGLDTPLYDIGARVEILQGAFAGYLGSITAASQATATMEINLLGRSVPVHVSVEEIRPLV
jgi:transcription antitermination factor NusG